MLGDIRRLCAAIALAGVCAAGLAYAGPAATRGATSAGVSANFGLRFAACIRAHGVPDLPGPRGEFPPGLKHLPAMPNFPDPTFPASGGELFPAIAGFNPTSPAFRHAAAACGLQRSIGQPYGG